MGRLLRFLIMFGPAIYSFAKKYMNKNQQQTNSNLPQRQTQQSGQQRTNQQGDFDFKEGENPLG